MTILCFKKKQRVQEAVRDFNLFKSKENRENVFEARKDYKYYCRKCKQIFNREKCKQMNEVRKKKTKEFWKNFKSKKIREKKIEIFQKMTFFNISKISLLK